jgi:hypothetical protein
MDLQAAKHHLGAPSFLAVRIAFVNAHSIPPLRRLLDPFPLQRWASTSIHRTQHSRPPCSHPPDPRIPASKFRNPESGVLKNCRRARGVLKRPRSVSAMLFLTPF